MANQRINMMQIRQVYRLYSQGVSRVQISKRLLLSRNTVKKYISLFKQEGIDNEALQSLSDSDLGKFLSSKGEKEIPEKLKTLKSYLPYFEKELKKVGVSKALLCGYVRDTCGKCIR